MIHKIMYALCPIFLAILYSPVCLATNSDLNDAFSRYLYGKSGASVEFVTNPVDLVSASCIAKFQIENLDYKVGVLKVEYTNTNLPACSVLLHAENNNKLMIYNHGHGGLPTKSESFAIDLISRAILNGFDVLIVSMPLVGLNEIDVTKEYWAVPWGADNKQTINSSLIKPWAHFHAFYETIKDPNYWGHFFIDSTLAALVLANPDRVPKSVLNFFSIKKNEGFPKYSVVNYVGLSGGGQSGLLACAASRFDKCILIAGFLPLYLRYSAGRDSWGDIEQVTDYIYKYFPYEHLMRLAQINTEKTYYILNTKDPCCFGGEAAYNFQRDFPSYNIELVSLPVHGFSANYIFELLNYKSVAPPKQ